MSGTLPAVRLARSEDASTIARMSRDYIESGLGWSWRPQRVLGAIRDPNTLVIVAGEDSVQGFCITQFAEEIGHVSLLAVDTKFRRRGWAGIYFSGCWAVREPRDWRRYTSRCARRIS